MFRSIWNKTNFDSSTILKIMMTSRAPRAMPIAPRMMPSAFEIDRTSWTKVRIANDNTRMLKITKTTRETAGVMNSRNDKSNNRLNKLGSLRLSPAKSKCDVRNVLDPFPSGDQVILGLPS